MATSKTVSDAGLLVRQSLQDKIRDGRYSPEDRTSFESSHLSFQRALSAFAANPKHGQDAPEYDAPLSELQKASASLAASLPDQPATISRALANVHLAGNALKFVTRAGFSSALAVRRASRSDDEDIGAAAVGAGDADAKTTDPNEPYLTSLAKLFPAEALSALLLVLAIDPAKYAVQRTVLIAIIALASGILRYLASRNPETGKADGLGVFVSVVSFLIYSAAMLAFGPLFGFGEMETRIVATVVAILWMGGLTAAVRKAPAP